MPQLANVTLNDGQATPVAHVFGPVGIDQNGVSTLSDRSSGIAVGYPSLTLGLKFNKNTRAWKATSRLMVPTLEVVGNSSTGITPPATKAYDSAAFTEYVVSERATLQERKNIRAYNANLQNHSVMVSLVETLEGFF